MELHSPPSLLGMAHKLALTSPYGKFRLGAVIARKRTVISLGNNQKKTHPLQCKFSSRPHLQNWLHAEIHALSFVQNEDLTDADMYIARILRKGQWANSKPCKGCMEALVHFGIRRMVYFEDGKFYKETIT